MFCKARKIPLPLEDKVTEKREQMVRQGILEPVQPGVTNASPVVWQRKKVELDEEIKDICTINTSQGLFKMCRLPRGLKYSSIFQNCIESTLKGIKGVVIFQDYVLVYGTTKEQIEKRMLAVKTRLREKFFYY